MSARRATKAAGRTDHLRAAQRAAGRPLIADEEVVAGDADDLGDFSDDALALRLGELWRNDARHVAERDTWMLWRGYRWEPDKRLEHMTRARDFLRREADAVSGKKAALLRSKATVASVVSLARSNVELVATVDQWDRDAWILCTPTGTVDLRTGRLEPPRQSAYQTKATAMGPAMSGTPAPVWKRFLDSIFANDRELIDFMQRATGYALTGSVREHALFFLWGQGGNGKGTFLNTISAILGDYSKAIPMEALLDTPNDRHPADIAMLEGARLALAQETSQGRTWDEAKIKAITGGDPITARFMRQDFFTYMPQFTLMISGNTKPALRDVGASMQRRLHLVPFAVNIPKADQDSTLPDRLKAEHPAILRWMIDGCLAWQRDGLAPPPAVRAATEQYLEGEDSIGQWLGDRCELGYQFRAAQPDLLASWQAWADANGGPKLGGRTFYKRLIERGFPQGKSNNARVFLGLRIRSAEALL